MVGGEGWQKLQRSETLRTEEKGSIFWTGLCLCATERSMKLLHAFLKQCFRPRKAPGFLDLPPYFLCSTPWVSPLPLQKETSHLIFLSLEKALESLQPLSPRFARLQGYKNASFRTPAEASGAHVTNHSFTGSHDGLPRPRDNQPAPLNKYPQAGCSDAKYKRKRIFQGSSPLFFRGQLVSLTPAAIKPFP